MVWDIHDWFGLEKMVFYIWILPLLVLWCHDLCVSSSLRPGSSDWWFSGENPGGLLGRILMGKPKKTWAQQEMNMATVMATVMVTVMVTHSCHSASCFIMFHPSWEHIRNLDSCMASLPGADHAIGCHRMPWVSDAIRRKFRRKLWWHLHLVTRTRHHASPLPEQWRGPDQRGESRVDQGLISSFHTEEGLKSSIIHHQAIIKLYHYIYHMYNHIYTCTYTIIYIHIITLYPIGSVCMPQYKVTFTIKKYPSYVSINLPYIRILWVYGL